jgi:hypothetical protein
MGESGKCLREKGMRHEMARKAEELEELTSAELGEVAGGCGIPFYGFRPVYGYQPFYGYRPVYRPVYGFPHQNGYFPYA